MGKFRFKYLAYKGTKIISAYDFIQNNQKLHTEHILYLKLEIAYICQHSMVDIGYFLYFLEKTIDLIQDRR